MPRIKVSAPTVHKKRIKNSRAKVMGKGKKKKQAQAMYLFKLQLSRVFRELAGNMLTKLG